MKIEHVLFSSAFFKITDPGVRKSFLLCSHETIFGTNKNQILEIGSCEWAHVSQALFNNSIAMITVDDP